jgi:cytidylate kinase
MKPMALITVSGLCGCRHDEVARLVAQRLKFQLITEAHLRAMIAEEFGAETAIPDKACLLVLKSLLARLATQHSLVIVAPHSEALFKNFPGVLRVCVIAPEAQRAGYLMLDHRLERPAAKQLLKQLEAQAAEDRKRKLGRARLTPHSFDLIFNSEMFDSDPIASLIATAAEERGLIEHGLLSINAEAQIQFQVRMALARHGVRPPVGVALKPVTFSHPSEEIFANLLDFYRIAWEYEPRSFPVEWDADGHPQLSFTPDFYLPEQDLYIELTTMKQSLVTRKNKKVKLLRSIYPHLNIQVFYQKDIQNLVFKYGLASA